MRFFSTPEAPCLAVCQACAKAAPSGAWADWSELDPATLEGAEPTRCARCGAYYDL